MAQESYDINSVGDVIGTIGVSRIVEITGRSPQAISNWRAQRRIASDLYVMLTRELARLGLTADPAVWGQEMARVRK